MSEPLIASLLLGQVRSTGISALVLCTLALILAGSWMMFRVVARRSTHQRHSVVIREWARQRGLHFVECREDQPPPAPLNEITTQRLVLRYCLAGRSIALVQLESILPAGSPNAVEARAVAGVWHLLIREIESDWPPTGLRPSGAAVSALDLFSLTPFPLLGASERFVVHGTKSAAAAALSRSASRGLLPPNVGMMVHGRTLVLDFSARPFDSIEFERMMAVAEQLVGHLPAPQ